MNEPGTKSSQLTPPRHRSYKICWSTRITEATVPNGSCTELTVDNIPRGVQSFSLSCMWNPKVSDSIQQYVPSDLYTGRTWLGLQLVWQLTLVYYWKQTCAGEDYSWHTWLDYSKLLLKTSVQWQTISDRQPHRTPCEENVRSHLEIIDVQLLQSPWLRSSLHQEMIRCQTNGHSSYTTTQVISLKPQETQILSMFWTYMKTMKHLFNVTGDTNFFFAKWGQDPYQSIHPIRTLQ